MTTGTTTGRPETSSAPERNKQVEKTALENEPMDALRSGGQDAKCDQKYCEGGYSD